MELENNKQFYHKLSTLNQIAGNLIFTLSLANFLQFTKQPLNLSIFPENSFNQIVRFIFIFFPLSFSIAFPALFGQMIEHFTENN